jgi:metal iron transporter
VAYIDPGNYATDTAAGASFQFKLLFIILMSNVFAIFLQSLCIKLGTVTGRNLAENCREHLPMWLNITLYIFAESAIIATDIAEVSILPPPPCFKLRSNMFSPERSPVLQLPCIFFSKYL